MKLLTNIVLPLYVNTTKTKTKKGKIILNLNTYRNMFFIQNNNAKKAMKEYINSIGIPYLGHGPFKLEYVYYHGSNRKVDVANTCSIIDKFTCDAITELGLWPDDNIDYVTSVEYRFGGVIPGDGKCELFIYKL